MCAHIVHLHAPEWNVILLKKTPFSASRTKIIYPSRLHIMMYVAIATGVSFVPNIKVLVIFGARDMNMANRRLLLLL